MRLDVPRRPLGDRGFSLVDTLVAASLVGVLLGAASTFNRAQLFTFQNQAVQSDVQTTGRGIVYLLTREIRRAGANPTCAAGMSAIAVAKPYKLQILSDLDGNGTTTGVNENITYEYLYWDGRFTRVANGSLHNLMVEADFTGSRFRYFNSAGVELVAGEAGLTSAQRDAVRRIRIELNASRDAADPENGTALRVSVANSIDLRNRYFVNAVACP